MPNTFYGTTIRSGNLQAKYVNDTTQWMKAPDGTPIPGLEPNVFWNKVMLDTKTVQSDYLFYSKVGETVTIPLNSGDAKPQWNRMEPLIENITPLAEGQMPTPEKVKQNMVRANVYDYGKTMLLTNKVIQTSFNPVMQKYTQEMKELGQRIDNLLAREALLAEGQDWFPRVLVKKDIATIAAPADEAAAKQQLTDAGWTMTGSGVAVLTDVTAANALFSGKKEGDVVYLTTLKDFSALTHPSVKNNVYCGSSYADLLALENWFESKRVYHPQRSMITSRSVYNDLKMYMIDMAKNQNVSYINGLITKGTLPLLENWNFAVDTMTKQEALVFGDESNGFYAPIHQSVIIGKPSEFKRIKRAGIGDWKFFSKAPGSAGTLDIIDQIAGIGIKSIGKGHKVTDPDAVVVMYSYPTVANIPTYSEVHRTRGFMTNVKGTEKIHSVIAKKANITGVLDASGNVVAGKGFINDMTTTDVMGGQATYAADVINKDLMGIASKPMADADVAKMLGIASYTSTSQQSQEIVFDGKTEDITAK